MLDLKDKVINNSRPVRIPIYGTPSISEFPCLTVVCKKNPNVTVEVEKGNQRAMEVASIFKGMAKIIEAEKDNWDANIDCYPKSDSCAHMSKIFLDTFAMESDDLIPYILLSNEELEKAFEIINKFDKPCILFSPISGGYKNKSPLALSKMLPEDKWTEIVGRLSYKYTILYTGYKENYYPLDYCIPIENLSIREVAALAAVCGKYLGCESGMAHLALAAGAFCHVVIPGYGYIPIDADNGTLSTNYVYTDEMWKYQTRRVIYYPFSQYKKVLDYL